MPRSNREIADVLFRMAELLVLKGDAPFRARAYRRAAIIVANLRPNLQALLAGGGDLRALLGVGPDLAVKIAEIARSGRLAALDRLEAETSPALAALSATPGLGPRRLQQLRAQLGVTSVEELRQAAIRGDLRKLKGFGPGFEARMIETLTPSERAP